MAKERVWTKMHISNERWMMMYKLMACAMSADGTKFNKSVSFKLFRVQSNKMKPISKWMIQNNHKLFN